MKFEILVGALYWRHIGFYASSFSALILLPVPACARYKVVCILCGWWTKFGASGVLFFRNRNESSYRLYIIHWICVKDIPYIAFWCSNHNLCGFLFRKQKFILFYFVSVVCLIFFWPNSNFFVSALEFVRGVERKINVFYKLFNWRAQLYRSQTREFGWTVREISPSLTLLSVSSHRKARGRYV